MKGTILATEKTEKMKRKDGKERENFKPRNTLKTRKKEVKKNEEFIPHRATDR